MNGKKVGIAVAIGCVLIMLAWGATWWRARATVAHMKALQSELFSDATKSLPEDERRAKFASYREQYDRLSEARKQELRRQSRGEMQSRMRQPIRQFFDLPKSQRTAFLDKQIKASEKRRQTRARTGAERTGAERGRGGGAGGGRPGAGRGEGMTEQERQERRDGFRRNLLDRTTPEQRAEMSEYMRLLRERRKELGLPDRGRGGRFGSSVS